MAAAAVEKGRYACSSQGSLGNRQGRLCAVMQTAHYLGSTPPPLVPHLSKACIYCVLCVSLHQGVNTAELTPSTSDDNVQSPVQSSQSVISITLTGCDGPSGDFSEAVPTAPQVPPAGGSWPPSTVSPVAPVAPPPPTTPTPSGAAGRGEG